jgi:hypothetical protein
VSRKRKQQKEKKIFAEVKRDQKGRKKEKKNEQENIPEQSVKRACKCPE